MAHKLTLAAVLILAGAPAPGCAPAYEDGPPNGLQGNDVVWASDKLAADLLGNRELNASQTQWVIVVDRMEDQTTERGFGHNYDIFLSRLKTNLARMGHGRVTLVDNREKFNRLRDQELDGAARDEFGQSGDHGGPPAPAAVQPGYALHGVVTDLPNRGSNYYLLEFRLTNLRDRTLAWTNSYEVTVGR